jgi:hypothetical protein
MLNKILLFALVGLVIAGGNYRRDTRLILKRPYRNVLNFACGAYGTDGSPTYNTQQTISYTFSGHPSWLSVSGSSLYGTPPAKEYGPWYVNVNYRGDKYTTVSGSSRYELTTDDFATGSLTTSTSTTSVFKTDPVVYSYGYPEAKRVVDASEYSYVVLVPILTTNTRTIYEKQPDTVVQQEPVSCTTYETAFSSANSDLASAQSTVSSINSRLTEALALVDKLKGDLATAQQQVTTSQSTVTQTSGDLASCRDRQAAASIPIVVPGKTVPRTETYTTKSYVAVAVGGYTTDKCGSIVVDGRGTGLISSVGSDYITVSSIGQLNFGVCTERSYSRGRSYFNIADTVTYETYQYGGKRWARRVICQ